MKSIWEAEMEKSTKYRNKKNSLVEISVQLEESYRQHLGLDRKTGEPSQWSDFDDCDPKESSRLLKELRQIAVNQKASADQKHSSFEHKGIQHYDGGIDTTFIQTTLLIFSSVGGAAAFFKLARDILLKWMENMSKRSVKLKVGDLEVEIKGTKDIEKAFDTLERLREAKEKDQKSNLIIVDPKH
jgi:hypothetical protein